MAGDYGVVLDSVNVSVLPYVPRSRVSDAPMDCWKPIATWLAVVGAEYVRRLVEAPVSDSA